MKHKHARFQSSTIQVVLDEMIQDSKKKVQTKMGRMSFQHLEKINR